MADIVRRLGLVAASLCVLVAALALASTGEGYALPGAERAFTTPVEPLAKAEDRLAAAQSGSTHSVGERARWGRLAAPSAPVPSAALAPSDPADDHASLVAWSRAFAGLAAALPEPPQAVADLSRVE